MTVGLIQSCWYYKIILIDRLETLLDVNIKKTFFVIFTIFSFFTYITYLLIILAISNKSLIKLYILS